MIERVFVYILIQFLIILITQEQFLEGSFKKEKSHKVSRSIKFDQIQKKHIPVIQSADKIRNLTPIIINGEKFLQVPEKLIGSKLQKYFTQTSSAVIAMSCCANTQVHRRCLRDMFHAQEHQCSDKCPGCYKKVNRQVFAQSRPNYLIVEKRKPLCDYCHNSLGVDSKNK